MMRITAFAFVATALLATGCGGGSTSVPQPPSVPPADPGLSRMSAPRTTQGSVAWQATAGGNRHSQAFQALTFFPGAITVDVGDSVTWTAGGSAHTITFFGRQTSPLQPITAPFGGSTYDGSEYTSSGFLPTGSKYTLTFTKAGKYPYACLFHPPEMVGVVVVQPRGTPYPHPQEFYTQQGLAEMKLQLEAAESSINQFPYEDGGTTLVAGIAPGLSKHAPTNPTVLRFLDADTVDSTSVTIPIGATLTWFNQSNNEVHTVTFTPEGQQPPGNPFSPPTGPPTGQKYDGTELVNSGVLFPGQSFSLTFTKAGTYPYACLFHDVFGMIGTVVVR